MGLPKLVVRLGVTPGVLVGYESERGWEFKISFRMRFSSEARLISSTTVVHSFCRRTTSSSIDLMYIFWRSRWFLCSDLDFDMLLMGKRERRGGAVPLCSPHLLSSAVIHGVRVSSASPWACTARLFFGN
jgi:hypothetical protein